MLPGNIYRPPYAHIMNELFIMADYKQCAFVVFQYSSQYIHTCYVDIISRLVSDNHIRRIPADNQAA